MRNSILIFLCLVGINLQAQVPARAQEKSILILDAIAHLGNGEVIPRSAIGIRDGKIDLVLNAFDIRLDSSNYDSIMHYPGMHMYPGFIAPNSRLGLVEIEAVRATRDFDDVGVFNSHVRSLTAYNTESRITSTVRTNGVLMAQVSPEGGRVSGQSSVFNLDAWNWEDACVKADDGIHLNWPRSERIPLENAKDKKKPEDKYRNELEELKQFFKDAVAYNAIEFHLEINLRLKALRPVIQKNAKIYVHVDRANEITDALYFFDNFDFDIVLVGAYDAWLVADLIKDRKVPVLLNRVHSLPSHEDDDIFLPFRLPKLLSEKGLLVALENSGNMEAMGTRNLPFYAGTAISYGLDPEEAVSMLSLNTAKILGIDKNYGSIEEGKFANIFISKGDAFDMRKNEVVLALIHGKILDLNNPQKALYQKYKNKYQP